MARLYELVVTEWLRAHSPQGIFTKVKEPAYFDDNAPSFEIDPNSTILTQLRRCTWWIGLCHVFSETRLRFLDL
jgi:hypothetical protein